MVPRNEQMLAADGSTKSPETSSALEADGNMLNKNESGSGDASSRNMGENPGIDGASSLLEEVRRLQQRLSEIDQRTKPASDADDQGKTLLALAQRHALDSLLFGQGSTKSNLKDSDEAHPDEEPILQSLVESYKAPQSAQSYVSLQRANMTWRQYVERRSLSELEYSLKRYVRDIKESVPTQKDNIRLDRVPDDKAGLLRVTWEEFKAQSTVPEREAHVIDILEGEPSLPDSWTGFSPRIRSKNKTIVDRDVESSEPRAWSTELPLPERIRIHSSLVISILSKVHGTTLNTSRTGTIVMIRPYKALVLYEARLQEQHEHLVKLHSKEREPTPKKSADVSPNPARDSEARGEDKLPGDQNTHEEGPDTQETASEDVTKPGVDKDEGDPLTSLTACHHLGRLVEFMDTVHQKQNYLQHEAQKVAFEDLWHIFKPGDEVIEPGEKHVQCYRVFQVTSPRHDATPKWMSWFRGKGKGDRTVKIHCIYVDFDGRFVGPVYKRFDIPRYEGLKDITYLPVYPLRSAKDKTLRQKLIERGKKFMRVARVRHMHYSGLTLASRDEIDSQVVIDFAEAFVDRRDETNTNWKPKVQLRAAIEPEDKKRDSRSNDRDSDDEDQDEPCSAECCHGEAVHDDQYVDQKLNEQYISSMLADTDEDENPALLSVAARVLQRGRSMSVVDEDYVVMSHRAFGFVLRSRSWAQLDIEALMDLDEYRQRQAKDMPDDSNAKENAFDNLVFPKDGLDRKKIVRSLVDQHFRDKDLATNFEERSDIVRGKGRGLIILLHGAPGVGKTTTAEGIAEKFDRPLFQITCGDLGTTAKEVEAALETNFALANKWNSILLLDEADVFLARRTPQDFKRNGLVAVFLRVLEYYAGILFLTTNRIGDFDEAFSSRIHISLHYPALDSDSTLEIFSLNWKLIRERFARKGKQIEIEESKIAAYAAVYWEKHVNARWNGRQIRNACQTALALAEHDSQPDREGVATSTSAKVYLEVKHVETVTSAYLEFMKYLDDVRDADQERYAYMMGIRRREKRDAMPYDIPYPKVRPSRLAEHKMAKQMRSEQSHYGQSEGRTYQTATPERQDYQDRQGLLPVSGGGPTAYRRYASPSRSTPPYQPPQESQPPRGWNPGNAGGLYMGNEASQQYPSPPEQDSFPAFSQYGGQYQRP